MATLADQLLLIIINNVSILEVPNNLDYKKNLSLPVIYMRFFIIIIIIN